MSDNKNKDFSKILQNNDFQKLKSTLPAEKNISLKSPNAGFKPSTIEDDLTIIRVEGLLLEVEGNLESLEEKLIASVDNILQSGAKNELYIRAAEDKLKYQQSFIEGKELIEDSMNKFKQQALQTNVTPQIEDTIVKSNKLISELADKDLTQANLQSKFKTMNKNTPASLSSKNNIPPTETPTSIYFKGANKILDSVKLYFEFKDESSQEKAQSEKKDLIYMADELILNGMQLVILAVRDIGQNVDLNTANHKLERNEMLSKTLKQRNEIFETPSNLLESRSKYIANDFKAGPSQATRKTQNQR